MGPDESSVSIREVGLRDGLQIEEPVPTEAKVRILEALIATGVPRIELAAFVSPRAVPAMADAADMARAAERLDVHGTVLSALVAGPGGADRAAAAGDTDVEDVAAPSHGDSR